MVAISLYRGNLHRVSDVPRQWPFPSRKLSLRNFKLLTRKRSLTVVGLLEHAGEKKEEELEKEGGDGVDKGEGIGENGSERLEVWEVKEEEEKGEGEPERGRDEVKAEASRKLEGKSAVGSASMAEVKTEVTEAPNISVDKEEKKKEMERKLHSLNEKKHVLVQMLKQILNAEEEMKRRNLQPPSGILASFPMLSDPNLDMPSAKRYTSKSVDENFSGDFGVESEGVANANVHPCHLNSLQSSSLSAASPVGRSTTGPFQQCPALHTPRGSSITIGHGQTSSNVMGNAAASPSRFGPNAHQSHPTSQLCVSVPGLQFVASSLSPAASGDASSSFRDSCLNSPPWN